MDYKLKSVFPVQGFSKMLALKVAITRAERSLYSGKRGRLCTVLRTGHCMLRQENSTHAVDIQTNVVVDCQLVTLLVVIIYLLKFGHTFTHEA